MQKVSAPSLIERLQAQIDACLSPHIDESPIAFVDFPDIRNVGDSAIWLGEIAYLKQRFGKRPDYVSRGARDFSDVELERSAPEGPIFIHGGGNFGDIWLGHQVFRERILQRWPGRPVVQFAQSIHYGRIERADETARIIDKHRNFTLLVRDQESLHFAEKHFNCRTVLCPDMAFMIGAVVAPKPQLPVLAMLREDREKPESARDLSGWPDMPVEDWITEPWLPVRVAKALGTLGELASFDAMRMRRGRFDAAARQRFSRGVRQIGRARALVTDRLHVHIISILMGRPHAVLDNSYGKIRRFMTAFSGGTDLAYVATSLQDAVEWARARAAELEGGR
jgi:exopolysaccharide biosynthesis predicted pyruvyltransferase EpsI